jgi:hypothetical protein
MSIINAKKLRLRDSAKFLPLFDNLRKIRQELPNKQASTMIDKETAIG